MVDQQKFDEYKMFIDDTARFTERRQNVSNLYVTVNSMLLTGLMFAIKDLSADKLWKLLFPLLIVAAGIFISLWWRQLIRKYKELVGFRVNMLRKMENDQELSWTERMYHEEDTLYPRNKDGSPQKGVGLNFSDMEARLPIVFLVLYGFAGFAIVMALFS